MEINWESKARDFDKRHAAKMAAIERRFKRTQKAHARQKGMSKALLPDPFSNAYRVSETVIRRRKNE